MTNVTNRDEPHTLTSKRSARGGVRSAPSKSSGHNCGGVAATIVERQNLKSTTYLCGYVASHQTQAPDTRPCRSVCAFECRGHAHVVHCASSPTRAAALATAGECRRGDATKSVEAGPTPSITCGAKRRQLHRLVRRRSRVDCDLERLPKIRTQVSSRWSVVPRVACSSGPRVE